MLDLFKVDYKRQKKHQNDVIEKTDANLVYLQVLSTNLYINFDQQNHFPSNCKNTRLLIW